MVNCEEDIKYFRRFLNLAKKGKIRLVAASVESLRRETKLGNTCYLVVMDDLAPVEPEEECDAQD